MNSPNIEELLFCVLRDIACEIEFDEASVSDSPDPAGVNISTSDYIAAILNKSRSYLALPSFYFPRTYLQREYRRNKSAHQYFKKISQAISPN